MGKSSTGSRRKFLLGAGAGTAAAAAVIATQGGKTVSATKAGPAARPDGRGYQLTEHIRNYYRTTTI